MTTPSSGAAPLDGLGSGRLFGRRRTGVGGLKPAQNFIGGVLKPCVRLVKLTGCFACQLTELVAIGHMRKCPKNQIRTHCRILLQEVACPPGTSWPRRCSPGALVNPSPLTFPLSSLDAQYRRPVQNLDAQLQVMKYAIRISGPSRCRLCTPRARAFPFPNTNDTHRTLRGQAFT